MILAGDGVANLSINNCVGWNLESTVQPFMAEVDDYVYQFTGRYRSSWWQLEPYDRWSDQLNFKYFESINWNDGTKYGVVLKDNTGKIQQISDGNLKWASSNRWDDKVTYRITVDTSKNPHTVTFDILQPSNKKI